MEIAAFTISSFSGIPLCRILLDHFSSEINRSGKLLMVHCHYPNTVTYSANIVQKPLKVFESFNDFKSQTAWFKIGKYFRILLYIARFLISARNPVVYTIDANTCTLALILKKIFFLKSVKVVYHQFEMDVPQEKSTLDGIFFLLIRGLASCIDLFVAPEINRLNYFQGMVNVRPEACMLLPNTTRLNYIHPRKTAKVVFGHIGGLSGKYYVEPILKFFSRFCDAAELLIVGRVSEDAKLMINKYSLRNVSCVGQVPHDQLHSYYKKIDFGLILYRPVDLNTRYCAPNKLYEFWSYGIPVIAPMLEGLLPVFSQPCLGKLVDMDDEERLGWELLHCASNRQLFDSSKIAHYFEDRLSIDRFLKPFETKLH